MWHYALNNTDASDVGSYVSPRTLWGMGVLVGRLGLEQSLFENVTDGLQKLFALDPSKQRLDPVHAGAVVKPSKEVAADSLQNPSDPDAGYCGHKGKGYQMQVMETYSPDHSQPNLITHVKFEAAHVSAPHSLLPAIEEAAQKRSFCPCQRAI